MKPSRRAGSWDESFAISTNDSMKLGNIQIRVREICIAVVLLVALVGFCYSRPGESPWLPPCGFYHLTGWYCPGCGGTRSVWCLLHGNWYGFFRNNLLVAPGLVFASCSLVWPQFFHRRWVMWIAVGVLLVWGILRNLPWEPFIWLKPVGLEGKPL